LRGRRVANAALARDRVLATVSHQTGTPAGAVTASMTLTFALLLAFGLAGTGALRLYVLSGDKRRLPAAILPLGERSRRSTCSFAI
jgi:hypothetical protein